MLETIRFSIHRLRTADALRKLSLLGGMALVAIVPTACSSVDDEVAGPAPVVTERKTVEKVTRNSRSYAYEKVAVVTASLKMEEDSVPATISAPYNRGAWTCSPSGFGQRSRCFLRQ